MSDTTTTLAGSAVREVADLATKASKLEIITTPLERTGKYFLRNPDGSTETVYADSPFIGDLLATPGELVAYVGKRKDASGGLAIVTPRDVSFRFSFEKPEANRVTVPLIQSAPWKALCAMVGTNYSGQTMNHFDLYRLLRVTLRDCMSPGSNLPQLVRNMKWNVDGVTNSTLEQTKKTLGASIAASVTSAGGDLPEQFTVTVSVYDNFKFPQQITVDLDTVPDQKMFRLTPYPGSIETAQIQTLDSIRDLFAFESEKALCEAYIGA